MSTPLNAIKKYTGLTGLAVAKNPTHTLNVYYGKILRVLDKMPKEAAYRRYTEELITSRLAIVKEAKSAAEIEEKVNCGQVEELILQAQNELALARTMTACRGWESLKEAAPPNQWTWPPAKIHKKLT